MKMRSEEDLREYTKQLKVEKQILLDENKNISIQLSAKKSLLVKCFKLFENYRNILINVNNICKCNAINNSNNEWKRIFDNKFKNIDVLINDSENVIQKFGSKEKNRNKFKKQTKIDGKPELISIDDNEDSITCIESDVDQESDETKRIINEIKDMISLKTKVGTDDNVLNENLVKRIDDLSRILLNNRYHENIEMKSVETQVDYEDMDYENCNQGIESEEDMFEMSDNTSLNNNNNISDDQTVDTNKTIINNKRYFHEAFKAFEKLENNNMFAVNPSELENVDSFEKIDKDYVNEILESEDFISCPKKYHKIDDKSDRPLIVGNFKKLSEVEKDFIRKSLLHNKNLIKRRNDEINYLSVPQIIFNDYGKPVTIIIFVGYECPYNGCDYRNREKYVIKDHINAKHLKVYPFKCEFCDSVFPSKSRLSGHKYANHVNQKIKCDYEGCNFVAKHKPGLTAHKNTVHLNIIKTKDKVCDWPECEARFNSRGNLKRHIDFVHKNIKEFQCHWPGCDANFGRKNQLIIHNRSHTGEKPYACDWPGCELRFTCKGYLRRHHHIHEGFKPHSCPWNGCEVSFLRTAELKIHIGYHETGKHMKCLCCVNRS